MVSCVLLAAILCSQCNHTKYHKILLKRYQVAWVGAHKKRFGLLVVKVTHSALI